MDILTELYKALKPLRKKIILEKWMQYIVIGCIAGMTLDLGIIVLSKWVLIPNLFIILASVILLSWLCASVTVLFKLPGIEDIAKKGDALGYKERFITAIEISQKGDNFLTPMYKLALEDAVNAAKNADFDKRYSISLPKKKLWIIGILMVGTIVAGFTPSPVKSKLELQLEIKEKAKSEIVKIEKLQKELENNPKISSKELKRLNKELDTLKADLKKVNTKGEIVRASQRTQQQLKKISKESVQGDLRKLGEKLSSHELTRALGDQLQQGNIAEIRKNLDDLQNRLKKMDKDQIQQLASILKDAANEIENNSELQQILNDYSQAVKSGDLEGLADEYEKLGQILEYLSMENQDLREAIENISKAMASNNPNNKENEENQQQSQGSGTEEKEGQKQGSETGKGQGEGQGQGQGTGQGEGQGQGSGTGQGQGQNKSGGQGRGQGHKPNEKIYSRQAQDKQDYDAQVDGIKNQSGDMHKVDQKTIGNRGVSVPYEEVYQQYRQDAIKFLEDDTIPYGIKNLVEEYFSSLE